MKKSELVYRELLQGAIEKKRYRFTQLDMAKSLKISLSTVNSALKPMRKMGAVRVKRRSLEVVNLRKILYYWASARNIGRDVIYRTRADLAVSEIEKQMPPEIVFGAYSAYKFRFDDVPADYSEVYVYCSDDALKDVARRFPQSKNTNPNVFVLRKEFADKEMPAAQVFVDLWNLKEWYSKEFVNALEEKLHGILA